MDRWYICLVSWSTHSFVAAAQKVHLCSVQIVSRLRSKKRICCSFGVRVKSVGRTKRAILVLAKRGAAAISIWHSRPLTLHAHLCGPALKDANNSMLRQDHDLKEWSSLGIKGCPAFLDMGTAHWEAQKPPNVCQRVPWRIRSQDKQTVCGFWPGQWLNGCYGGAAGVSAFSGRSVFVARLKEFVRLKGSWTGPGASMSYTNGGLCQGAECNWRKQSKIAQRPTLIRVPGTNQFTLSW